MNECSPLEPADRPAGGAPAVCGTNKSPPRPEAQAGGLLRFVYTNNPFYLLSAGLVLWGLRLSFDTGGESFETLALMAGLAGYTSLLGAAACYLIRLGQVWEDVRTILLVIVLMFLAISVTLDETLATNPRVGTLCFLGGLAFSIALSECLLRGIRLTLPTLFRVPYYWILALFYLYPVAISPLVPDCNDPKIHWGLFGFPGAAGLVFLTLLPAVGRGPRYVGHNGSPWQWPWYPWVLFGLLGFGVCARSVILCMSLDPVKGADDIFGPYFLVPFLLAVNLLVLEVGIVSHLTRVVRWAMIAPIGLLALAVTGPPQEAADLGFLQRFHETLGASPLYLTLLAAIVFYAVAMARRVSGASIGLTVALAALAVCGPRTFGAATTAEPVGLPILLAAALQLAIAVKKRDARPCLLAACCLVAGLWVDLRETAFTACGGLLPLHMLLAAVLLIGAVFRGRLAVLLQRTGAVLMLAGGLAFATCDPRWLGNPPPGLVAVYPLLAIVAALAYGQLVGNRWYFAAALAILGGWLAAAGWHAYRQLRQTMAGLGQIAWGAFFFLLAVLISLTKVGIPQRWLARRRNQN